jgi:hypothetical protein
MFLTQGRWAEWIFICLMMIIRSPRNIFAVASPTLYYKYQPILQPWQLLPRNEWNGKPY